MSVQDLYTHDTKATGNTIDTSIKEVDSNHGEEHGFYPFHENAEQQSANAKVPFPKLGFGALAGAISLAILAAVLLIIVGGPAKVQSDWRVHVYKTHHWVTMPKPAAWISAILSFISVLLHIALSEGLNVAWWFHLKKQNVTVRDLHEIWNFGTSSWSAFKGGMVHAKNGIVRVQRRATSNGEDIGRDRLHSSYIALATLFVATIPLNGFLLQNAITVVAVSVQTKGSITLPMISPDGLGSSGVYAQSDQDTTIFSWSQYLGTISQSISPKIPALADLTSFKTACPGQCAASIQGAGLKVTCTEAAVPYNISIDIDNNDFGSEAMQTTGAQILSIEIGYNISSPYRINLSTLWKQDARCIGAYTKQTCTMDLATVEYPVVVTSNVQEVTASGVVNSTIVMLDLDLLNTAPTVLQVYPDTGSLEGYTTSMAGVAGYLAQVFNSSVQLTYNEDNLVNFYKAHVQGLFGQQQIAANSNFSSLGGDTAPCTANFGNVGQQLLARIYSAMFQLGVYTNLEMLDPNSTSDGTFYLQHPVAVQTFKQNQYRIIWGW
jgi:hypothetical protein